MGHSQCPVPAQEVISALLGILVGEKRAEQSLFFSYL